MQRRSFITFWLFVLSGIIYNSWPLGYLLDSPTAHFGLASDLEEPNHPYAWVFIGGDVITGLILVGLTFYIYKRQPKLKLKYVWAGLCLGLFLFGFFTGFGAAAPDQCHGGVSLCTRIFNKNLSLDGLESSIAAFGLLTALFSSALLSYATNKYYRLASWAVFSAYFIVGGLLVLRILNGLAVHSIQRVFLVLCGLGLVSIGAVANKLISPA